MKEIIKTKDAYKNKSKIYMFYRPRDSALTEGFVADGTIKPIWFVLFRELLERRDISKYFGDDQFRFQFKQRVIEADEWVYHEVLKTVFLIDMQRRKI